MPIHDIFFVIQWWFVLFIIGLTSFPIASRILPGFVDKGYGFAKIIGTILLGYAIFVLGIIKVLPFTIESIYAVFFVYVLFSLFLFKKTHNAFSKVRAILPVVVFEEILFFAALLGWTYVRSFTPEIFGLEKYMDFGFVNSILRSTYFPPKDMWFTPFPINYYYFGHFLTAMLTKASLLPSLITYNLMIATLFALSFVEVFSLAATLVTSIIHKATLQSLRKPAITTGILAALLTTLAGNLHIIYGFFEAYPNENPKPFWELAFKPLTFSNGYWYPNATRFIEHTIHEFPMYSWVVADLHGHVLDIPIVLLTISVLCAFFLKSRSFFTEKRTTIKNLLFIGFLLGVMYMTNAWDGLTYLLLTGLVLLGFSISPKVAQKTKPSLFSSVVHFNALKKQFSFYPLHFLAAMGIIVGGFLLFSLPFSYFFNPSQIVSGIGILCSPKFLTDIGSFGPFLFEVDHCQKSLWWQLLILYGFFYFFVCMYFVILRKLKDITRTDVFVVMLIMLSTVLIIIPEFAYMKDIYPAHYRANTMFKLVFQAFIMLSITSAFIITRILLHIKYSATNKIPGFFFLLASIVLVSLVLTYPFLATKSYYGDLKNYIGIDGLQYLKVRFADDYNAINWINETISGQPVILEAQGDSYTDYARVSANTGLPTVLGWTVHEWLWRGTYDVPAPRITDVQTLYESTDIEETRRLLDMYKVEYVFLGELERQKYPNLSVEKFEELGKVIYQSGNTSIIQLPLYH